MSIGTTISPTQGVVQTSGGNGVTVTQNGSNVGFMPYSVQGTTAITTTPTTISAGTAGLTTLSGTATALSVSMPLASAAPGSLFAFRNLSTHAHVLTGSQETVGTKVFSDISTTGSKLVLSGAVGQSVVLFCDGKSFLVVAARSGSAAYSISGT